MRDPVTPEVYAAVMRRDGYCVATRLDPTCGPCRDKWGGYIAPHDERGAQLDHIHHGYGKMGVRAPSDPAHLVRLCAGHHLGGWATSHRAALRAYLAEVTP